MKHTHLKKLIRAGFAAVVVCSAAGLLLENWIGSARMHQRLTARLALAFGRPVEVGNFGLRFFPSPGVQASDVTIAENPQFGAEYFLRAQTVSASVRWMALLAGRLELGTLTFEQPSLNLVRNADGRWNVESWLPREAHAMGPQVPGSAERERTARLREIEIVGGRVNFRRGYDVRPFALTNVTGRVAQESAGRWHIALAAEPMRATVRVQGGGTLWLEGDIAGTSARLQPAELRLTWSDAALADALRMLGGNDAGLRGTFAAQASAKTVQSGDAGPARWQIKIGAQVGGLHRWDMAQRDDSPGISLTAAAEWVAGSADLDLRQIIMQGARTNLVAKGSVNWSEGISPRLEVANSEIGWGDVLAAYRSFSRGVDDALIADGVLHARGEVGGWPPKVVSAAVDSTRVNLGAAGVPLAAIENFKANWGGEEGSAGWRLRLLGAQSGSSAEKPGDAGRDDSVEMAASSGRDLQRGKSKNVPVVRTYELDARGTLAHVERMLTLAREMGKPINAAWTADGGVDVDLAWKWNQGEKLPRPAGTLRARALELQLPLLNQPIELADVSVNLSASSRNVTVSRAEALGARWSGTMAWREGAAPAWKFDLAADKLDVSEADRWLGPRARPNWLARIFGGGATRAAVIVTPAGLHASGTLRVDDFRLQGADATELRAGLDLDGRELTAEHLTAKIGGGTISGSLEAKLTASPAYRFTGRLDGVSAVAITQFDAVLRTRPGGKLTGNVEFSASGVGRDALLASLAGRGYLSLSGADIEDVQLSDAVISASKAGARDRFTYLQSGFSVGAKQIQLQDLVVVGANEVYLGSGRVDFARRLDLDLHPVPPAYMKNWLSPNEQRRVADPLTGATRHVRVSGVLEAIHVRQEAPPAVTPAGRQ
jgi:hypothetical protein